MLRLLRAALSTPRSTMDFSIKLAAKARDIKVGPAEDFGNYMAR